MNKMLKSRCIRRLLSVAVLGLGTFTPRPASAAAPRVEPPARATEDADKAIPSANYLRVVDADDGQRVRLETSVRTMTRDGAPTVYLVGVSHVGDAGYYKALQEFLDEQSVVLFEGVKPSGVGEASKLAGDDAGRASLTERRIRLLATLVERHRTEHGEYPGSLDDALKAMSRPLARIASGAMVDGWGRALEYIFKPADPSGGVPKGSFDIMSLGSDGAAGGEGFAKDRAYSRQKKLTKGEIGDKRDGIQVQLADALGLEFQLTAIDYSHDSWRNSDMSIDEVQARLKESGASGEALFNMLDGSSLPAKAMSLLLGVVKSSPAMRSMAKLMMIEMLARADDLMTSSTAMGEASAKLMRVIVLDRNQVVLADLKKVIEAEGNVPTVALFYGAGHLRDMESVMTGEMGYAFSGERWFPAIEMDLKKAGISRAQAEQMRGSVRDSMGGQTGKKRVPKKE